MDAERRRQYKELVGRLHLAEAEETPVSETTTAITVIERAAADIGNATALVAAVIADRTRVVELPTAKALFGLRLPTKLQKDDVIYRNGNGLDVALGMAALRYADEPIASRGHADRYGPFTREFALAGLALLARTPTIMVKHLAVLVPEKYATNSTAAAVATALRGTHTFTLAGRECTITIRRITLIREGEAAWYALAASHAGHTIVIDGGGGTTNVALGRDGAFAAVRTRDTGLQRAWDTLDATLRRDEGVTLSALERYELERALIANTPFQLVINGQSARLDVRARAMLDPVARSIAADIKEIVPKWARAERIWYCGGQALHLVSVMREEFGERLSIAPRPVEQNVRGALLMLGADVNEVVHASEHA